MVLSNVLVCTRFILSFFIQYEDDEGDKVLLVTDGDLIAAVNHARSLGLKVIRLFFYSVVGLS